MEQTQNDEADPLPGTRPPQYVVVTWMSEQLRGRLHRNRAALSDILRPRPERFSVVPADRQLEDREAEP
jgi:hypothetical protein